MRGAIERAEARMRAAPLDTFDHVYADVPPEINAQRQEFAQELEAQGGPA